MAQAVTPNTIIGTVFGDYHITMAKFDATIDTGDTWVSGLTGVAFWLASVADTTTTQASQGGGVTYSAGTFTLYPGEDNTAMHLLVVSK